MQCSPASCNFSLLGPNILLSILFSFQFWGPDNTQGLNTTAEHTPVAFLSTNDSVEQLHATTIRRAPARRNTTILTMIYVVRMVYSSVGIRWATGWMSEVLGFDSWRGLGIFLFTIVSRTALEPTQPPIQWIPGALSLGVKRQGLWTWTLTSI
jgi:hypothetical protein